MATIFIVDDSVRHGGAFARVLRMAGYHTVPLTDASMAVDVLQAIKADTIIVNLEQHEDEGAALVEILRHDSRWSAMPVILTGAKPASGYERLRHRVGIGEVLLESESTPGEVLRQVRKFTEQPVAEGCCDAGDIPEAEN